MLETSHQVTMIMITRFCRLSKTFAKSDYKLISFYIRRSVDIAMLINKFGLPLGGGSKSYYHWRGLLRNYVRDNALYIATADFNAKFDARFDD